MLIMEMPDLNSIIQLAVAPVFLLTAIAGFLGVLTNRLARIIDRSRLLKDLGEEISEDQTSEMGVLIKRSRSINLAITACTVSALFVCVLIAFLFIKGLFSISSATLISIIFIISMISLITGLVFFLTEVYHAIRWVQIIGLAD